MSLLGAVREPGRVPQQVFGMIQRELDSRMETVAGIRGGAIVEEVETEPIEGMKPGTSGLRKKVGLRKAWMRCRPSGFHG